jgi:hypothetical protein
MRGLEVYARNRGDKEMKTLMTIALIAMLALAALAQRAQNNTDEQLQARNAPDVFVYGASAYGPDKKGDSNFTIEVKNTGAKTITAIDWEYILPDMVPGYDKGSHVKLRSDDMKLRPEERKKLTRPVHHYADKFVTNFRLDTLRIVRVEYEDGSSWQRPSDDR